MLLDSGFTIKESRFFFSWMLWRSTVFFKSTIDSWVSVKRLAPWTHQLLKAFARKKPSHFLTGAVTWDSRQICSTILRAVRAPISRLLTARAAPLVSQYFDCDLSTICSELNICISYSERDSNGTQITSLKDLDTPDGSVQSFQHTIRSVDCLQKLRQIFVWTGVWA